ncbi:MULTISPECIES: bacteriophage abortive infection AbiH family protein [Clostridium]|uniref:bacteriophage abortive infection AbiH family protein n=1 Tax=Clostridium TaxID=1485 RepID=UPI001EF366DA|nr:bacteriophage abortive infection AbiH family protein [Clostridium beijerinckii]
MKILVIGNGFDLEHGLPTQYKDFLDFVKTIKNIFVNKWFDEDEKEYFFLISRPNGLNNSLLKYFLEHNFLKNLQDNIHLRELMEKSKDNVWIQYFLENIEYENKGWIDFESEISHAIQCFDYMKNYCEYCKKYIKWPQEKEQEKCYKEEIVKKILVYTGLDIEPFELIGENLKEIIDILKTHLDNLIRCLEIYLEECVRKINIECLAADIKDIKFDKVLSFNYTNTYERIYGFNTNKIEYHYIHGKADINSANEENNMVLGIDEYLGKKAKNKDLEFIAFKKYFQRIYKKTENTYKKWIEEIEENYKMIFTKEERYREALYRQKSETYINKYKDYINNLHSNKSEIYIFGHSLDITDKDIIKELIECPNTETTIFYYDKGVYAQQIANLVKVIGQDELIKRVSGANPTIIFKQQQKKIERN